MNTAQVAASLKVRQDYVRRTKGKFRYHCSFFWRNQAPTQAQMKEKILAVFLDAKEIETGEQTRGFQGGCKSGSAQDSFVWVKFKLD